MDGETLLAITRSLGSLCIICFFALFYMAIFHIDRHDAFVDLATRNQRKSLFDKFPPPIYHPRRLWRLAFLVMAWFGGGYVVFAIMSAVMGWMPDDWRVSTETWQGERLSTVVSFYAAGFSMFFLPLLWDKVVAASQQRRRHADV